MVECDNGESYRDDLKEKAESRWETKPMQTCWHADGGNLKRMLKDMDGGRPSTPAATGARCA